MITTETVSLRSVFLRWMLLLLLPPASQTTSSAAAEVLVRLKTELLLQSTDYTTTFDINNAKLFDVKSGVCSQSFYKPFCNIIPGTAFNTYKMRQYGPGNYYYGIGDATVVLGDDGVSIAICARIAVRTLCTDPVQTTMELSGENEVYRIVDSNTTTVIPTYGPRSKGPCTGYCVSDDLDSICAFEEYASDTGCRALFADGWVLLADNSSSTGQCNQDQQCLELFDPAAAIAAMTSSANTRWNNYIFFIAATTALCLFSTTCSMLI